MDKKYLYIGAAIGAAAIGYILYESWQGSSTGQTSDISNAGGASGLGSSSFSNKNAGSTSQGNSGQNTTTSTQGSPYNSVASSNPNNAANVAVVNYATGTYVVPTALPNSTPVTYSAAQKVSAGGTQQAVAIGIAQSNEQAAINALQNSVPNASNGSATRQQAATTTPSGVAYQTGVGAFFTAP